MRKLSSFNLYRGSVRGVSQSQLKLSPQRISQQYQQLFGADKTTKLSMGDRRCYTKAVPTTGKGRFGKRALSISYDHIGHSNDSNSNSNDSGIDFHSCESQSQLSWNSEDAHLGRSTSLAGAPTVITIPQFTNSYGKELCEELLKEKSKVRPIIRDLNSNSVTNIFDINTARLLMPEKAQLEPQNMRISPESSDEDMKFLTPKQILGSSNVVSALSSPIPMKRARFSYTGSQLTPANGKGSGLKLRNQNQSGKCSIGKRLPPGVAPTLTSILSPMSRDGRVQLQIVTQPEEQHRARYQTEGSRGAIKDRKGNGFPTVKLVGYDKQATLQIFIGTDQGKVNPHMFYQACKVTGKSSTPCIEKKVEGTIVIEIEFEPTKEMIVSCDCVGILKERNVDVEQRFPFHHASQSRKKSTKCRMVFRTTIINSQGMEETLQLSSNPILCTQPPGHPEICKQSAYDAPAKGGIELFIIGKNFLKDTKVVFQEEDADEHILWESVSEPLKDYLQQNHLICPIPPYKDTSIQSSVECKFTIISGGKQSEPHRFTYLPNREDVSFGIPTTASSATSSVSSVLSPDSISQSLTQSQSQSMMDMDIQVLRSMGQLSNDGSSMSPLSVSDASSPSSVSSSPNHCQQLVGHTMHSSMVTSPTTSIGNSVTALSFNTSTISPLPSAQERQVVNELQSILEQSQQQQDNVATNMLTSPNMITIKTENTFDMNVTHNPVATSVPLDLQFPSAVTVPVPSTDTTNLIQSPLTYGNQGLNTTTFATPSSINCMNQTVNAMLTRSQSMEVINVEQQIISELLPNSQVSLSQTNSPSIVPQTTSMVVNCTTVHDSVETPATSLLQQTCNLQNMLKIEPQSIPIQNQAIAINGVNQVQAIGVVNQGNFMVGDLNQGTIANAITQMSDNELINYINPSCFEQNLALV